MGSDVLQRLPPQPTFGSWSSCQAVTSRSRSRDHVKVKRFRSRKRGLRTAVKLTFTGPQNLLRVTANTTCTKEHSRRLSLRSLPRVSDKVRFIQHGLSRTVSNRPVCIQSLPRRQLARLPTKMSCYSSTLSHIHIYTYTTTYELARLLIVQSLLLYAYGISYCNTPPTFA